MVPESHESQQAYIWPREKMSRFLETLDEEGDADKLHAVDRREDLVEAIRKFDPAVNGNVDQLMDQLSLYRREAQRKQQWTKESEKSWPRRIWEKAIGAIKAHPYITTGLVLGAGGAALYYTGWGAVLVEKIKAWLLSFLPQLRVPQIPIPHIPTPTLPTLPTPPVVPSLPPLPTVPNPANLPPLVPPLNP